MAGRDPDIYKTLLENLSDGVLAIGFDGSVKIANPAFCRMFRLDSDDVADRLFSEIFVEYEGFDDFVQIILDAIVDAGSAERRITSVRIDDELRSLSVTTSYLTGGGAERVAVIAVVSDITEVRELRESELRMAKVVENQLEELQNAYRDIEARNTELTRLMKRVQVARGVAALLVIGLFLAFGSWYLRPLDLSGEAAAPAPQYADEVDDPLSLPTLVVEPEEFRSTLSLRGYLAPGHVVKVVSPVNSHVSEVHAQQGQSVTADDPLLELDTGQLTVEYRQARVEFIRARDKFVEIEDWDNSGEMTRARRALRRARIALDEAEGDISETAFLLEQGIISASEHEQALQRHWNRKLDYEEAERELDTVQEKGGAEAMHVARLEMENARERLQTQEEKLDQATLKAPIAGIIVVEQSRDGKPLEKGRPVSQGELLLSIADLERISVSTSINEVDVRKIEPGQQALITGPGFPGVEMAGVVTSVSARANTARGSRSKPQFDVTVTLDRLDEAERTRLRVGMTAYVTIVVHSDAEALLIPIDAVQHAGDRTWVSVVDRETASVEERTVELGFTTLDSVEVLQGLAAGETIALPRR